MRPQTGFSLTELMVTISIMAILLNVAVPSFQSTIEANRVDTAVDTLYTSIVSARAEALKQGKNLVLCQSEDEASCADYNSGATAWDGWVILALDSMSKSKMNLDEDEDQLVHVQNTDALSGVIVEFSQGRSLMVDSRSNIRVEADSSSVEVPATTPYFTVCGLNEENGYAKAVVINGIGQPLVISEPTGDISLQCETGGAA